jgi:ATP-binding cassette, subfamily B, bacterial
MKTQNTNISQALQRVFSLLKLDQTDIYTIYIYSIFAGIVSLSLPLGIQSIIGFVLAGSLSTSIIVLLGLVLLGTFFNGLLQVRQLQLIEKIEQKIFVRYALEYADRLPKLNIELLDNYYLPELVNRFFDITSLQKSLHKLLVDIPTAVIQILLGTILLAFYHPLFIAFGLVLLTTVVLILRYTSKRGFSTSMETSDYKYKVAAWFEEMARGIKSFKYAQDTNLHIKKTDELLVGYLAARTNHFKVLKFQYWSLIGFKLLITAAMLLIGVFLLLDQQINIGQFIAADIVIISIILSIEKLIGIMDQVYEALTAVEKLNKIAEAEIEKSGQIQLPNHEVGVSVKVDNLDFYYHKDTHVLYDINFELLPKQWLLIQGKSGAGKTSLLRLLTGSFKNFSGKIIIDNLPIRNLNNDSLRLHTGILLSNQDIFLGSLLQNLTMGDEKIKLDQILEISKITGLENYILESDDGLDTEIDPVGKRLTAETKHFILLTRAVLGKYRLLLLEEPFKYLSDDQKTKLVDYLKNTNATIIIASEDLDIAKFCDKTLQLEDGKMKL